MFAMSNPCVTSGSSFVDFLDGSDSVFVDDFFYPKWALCAVEYMRHPWKQFC
jgi:hypothetical protein